MIKTGRTATVIAVVTLVAAARGSGAPPAHSVAAIETPSASVTAEATAAPTPMPSAAVVPSPPVPTGQMSHGRSLQTATALADGRVLVAGGYFDNVPITAADLFDPEGGTFTATGPLTVARGFDTATRLTDGRVLVAGGNPGNWDYAGTLIASAELYDPMTGLFSPTSPGG